MKNIDFNKMQCIKFLYVLIVLVLMSCESKVEKNINDIQERNAYLLNESARLGDLAAQSYLCGMPTLSHKYQLIYSAFIDKSKEVTEKHLNKKFEAAIKSHYEPGKREIIKQQLKAKQFHKKMMTEFSDSYELSSLEKKPNYCAMFDSEMEKANIQLVEKLIQEGKYYYQ